MDATLTTAQTFPNGTLLGAYNDQQLVYGGGRPLISPVTTATTAAGQVTFLGLDFGTAYDAAASVNGVWQRLRFITDPDPALDGFVADEQFLGYLGYAETP